MKLLNTVLAVLFSYTLFDLNLIRRKLGISTDISISREFSKKKRKRKRRKYQNQKRKRRKIKVKTFSKNFSTKAKDHRYSNQKTLRRMYRND